MKIKITNQQIGVFMIVFFAAVILICYMIETTSQIEDLIAEADKKEPTVLYESEKAENYQGEQKIAPRSETSPFKQPVIREVTAYSSRVCETDSTPFFSEASGKDVGELHRQGILVCATNAFPFGTKLEVQNVGVCEVWDRMNSRYKNRVDIYMYKDTQRALDFGLQKLIVKQIN